MQPSERLQALDRARAGDRTALGELLESYRAYAVMMVRAQVDGELQAKVASSDIVQDSFVAAIEAFAEFRGATLEEFLGWFRRIVLRTTGRVVGGYRGTAKRDPRREQGGGSWLDVLSGSSSTPSRRAIRHEEAALVAEALQRLPEQMRDALTLFFFDDLPHGEVGRRLGCSEGASRVQVTRALGRLRDELGPGFAAEQSAQG